MRTIPTLLLGLLLMICTPVHAAQTLESREGYFVLEFENHSSAYDSLEIVQMVEGKPAPVAVQTFDVTGQRQATLSGFANGEYLARLVDSSGEHSPVELARVQVTHRSLYQALALFVLGLAAFLMLVGILLSFVRRERDGHYA